MAQITAALVKELREKTGAGMMDCKNALTETDGAMEAAVDWLRKKGLAAAAKKAGRIAAEGLVAAVTKDNVGAVVEVNAETDFVALNESFQQFVRQVAELALGAGGDTVALEAAPYADGEDSVADRLTQLIATIGENMSLRRTATLSGDCVTSYVHAAAAPGLGKIAVLVGLSGGGDGEEARALGKQIAMHIAASNPQAVDVAGLDPVALERERTVLSDQARASGKPEEIVEMMVEGRLRNHYQEIVLLEQAFVMDPDKTVAEALEAAGGGLAITGFERYALGEGIEKKVDDFASEVASLAG